MRIGFIVASLLVVGAFLIHLLSIRDTIELGLRLEPDSPQSYAQLLKILVEHSLRKLVVPQSLYPTEVIPGFLYLGERGGIINYKHLEDLKVTVVINVAVDINYPSLIQKRLCEDFIEVKPIHFPSQSTLYEESKKGSRKCLKMGIQDNDQDSLYSKDIDLLTTMTQLLHKLRLRSEKVFIHCAGGRSRSAAFVLAYLMNFGGTEKEEKATLRETVNFLSNIRRVVSPNKSFMKELLEYEKSLYAHEEKNKSPSYTEKELIEVTEEMLAKVYERQNGIMHFVESIKDYIPESVRTVIRGLALCVLNM